MSISIEERRFIRNWEEQRKGGRLAYIPMYTFGYFVMLFMTGVALGLFSGLPFIKPNMLIGLAVFSLVGAIALAFWQWNRGEKKFRSIIQREISGQEHNSPQPA